jgi:hypothetical protein
VHCGDDIDECEGNTACLNGAECVDGTNAITCTCANGYAGTHCETDINECEGNKECLNGSKCADGVNSFKCVCQEGFQGHFCGAPTTLDLALRKRLATTEEKCWDLAIKISPSAVDLSKRAPPPPCENVAGWQSHSMSASDGTPLVCDEGKVLFSNFFNDDVEHSASGMQDRMNAWGWGDFCQEFGQELSGGHENSVAMKDACCACKHPTTGTGWTVEAGDYSLLHNYLDLQC